MDNTLKDCEYAIIIRTTEPVPEFNSDHPFRFRSSTITNDTVAMCQYLTEANKIARLLASDWHTYQTGNIVTVLVVKLATGAVMYEHKTAQDGKPVPPPAKTDSALEPYDGVPADTGSV